MPSGVAALLVAFALAVAGPSAQSRDRPDLSGRWNEVEITGARLWSAHVSIRQNAVGLLVAHTPGRAPSEYRFDGDPLIEVLRSPTCGQRTVATGATWDDDRLVLAETTRQARCSHGQPLSFDPLDQEEPDAAALSPVRRAATLGAPVVLETAIELWLSGDVLTVEVVRRSASGGEVTSTSRYVRADGA